MKITILKIKLFAKSVTIKVEEKNKNISIKNQQPKIDNVSKETILPSKQNYNNNPRVSAYENHRHVIIGPTNAGKSFYMLKIGNKDLSV